MTTKPEEARPVSELELAALAAAAMPSLQIRGIRGGLRTTESGQWLTFVDSTGHTWLAWAPSGAWTAKRNERYLQVTNLLQSASRKHRIPFSVFPPEGQIKRAQDSVVLISQYPGGNPLANSDLEATGLLPRSLGSALAALHELPPGEYARAARQRAGVEVTRAALRRLIDSHSSAIPSRLCSRWVDTIDEDSLWKYEPVPLHGSLAAPYVYAATGGAVVGLVRFDAAAVGDPAQDMVWLMYYASDDFLSEFEASYSLGRKSADLHVLTRAQLLSELETLRWYARGVEAEDRIWRRQGVKALRDLDTDIGDHRLVPVRPDVVDITFTVEEEPLMRLQSPARQKEALAEHRRNESEGDATEVIHTVIDAKPGPFTSRDGETPSGGSPDTGSIEVP